MEALEQKRSHTPLTQIAHFLRFHICFTLSLLPVSPVSTSTLMPHSRPASRPVHSSHSSKCGSVFLFPGPGWHPAACITVVDMSPAPCHFL